MVSASDATGAHGSASFTWTVAAASACAPGQLLGSPGFETGAAAPWASSAGIVVASSAAEPAHSGRFDARFGAHGVGVTDKLVQAVTLPAGCANVQLTFWIHVDTSERPGAVDDTLAVQLLSPTGAVAATLATYSNLDAAPGYQQVTFNLAASAGTRIRLRFLGGETGAGGGMTNFVLDDTALNVS